MAAKKQQQTAMIPWQAELEAEAEKGAAQEQAPAGRAIKIKNHKLMIDDNPVPDNELSVVVLEAVQENQYFGSAYDPENPGPPVCYSFREQGDAEEDMKPHEKVESPEHSDCATCPHNVFGSADTGKGKACKNIRKLAVIPADAADSAEDISTAEPRILKVPVTSVRGWAGYVRGKLSELKRPPLAVVTNISLVPDDKTQFKLVFAFEKLIDMDGAKLKALKAAALKAYELMAQPYQPRAEEAPAPKGKAAKKAKKF